MPFGMPYLSRGHDFCASQVAGMSTRPNPLATYSPHVDVWAVGVLVWEALAGSPPFAHDDLQQTAHNIQYAPLTDFPASMSAACRDFVRRVRWDCYGACYVYHINVL